MMKDVSAFWQFVDKRMEEIGINSIRELEKRAGFQTSAILRRRSDLNIQPQKWPKDCAEH